MPFRLPPVEMTDDELNTLGDKMRQRMADLRDSTLIEKLHIKGRTALLTDVLAETSRTHASASDR